MSILSLRITPPTYFFHSRRNAFKGQSSQLYFIGWISILPVLLFQTDLSDKKDKKGEEDKKNKKGEEDKKDKKVKKTKKIKKVKKTKKIKKVKKTKKIKKVKKT